MKKGFLILLMGALMIFPTGVGAVNFAVQNLDATPNTGAVFFFSDNSSDFSFNLVNPGNTSTRDDALNLYIREDDEVGADLSQAVSVTFDFTNPAGITDTLVIGGAFYDDRSGEHDHFSVTWIPQTTGWTGSGSLLLKVTLEDLVNYNVYDSGDYCDDDYYRYKLDAKFELVSAPPVSAPEPGTLLLLGLGLVSIGLLRKRQ